MTNRQYAGYLGLTWEQYRRALYEYIQCEGYDTLEDWIKREATRETYDPYDGGRGATQPSSHKP